MNITHVSAENLKGRSFGYDLSPLTLVLGPNYSGKTALIESIRLALMGYIPEIGKQNKATFELASSKSMKVSVDFEEDGKKAYTTRTFRLEKGSVKAEVTGEDKRLVTPLLDATAYFELSERDRIDYVFEQVTMPATFTAPGIIAKLERITFGEEHTEEIEQAKSEVIGRCRDVFESAEHPNITDAISNLTDEALKEDATIWKRKADDTQSAVRVINELKNREGECSAETLTDLRNRASHLSAQLDECNRETGALRGRAAEAQKLKARRALLADVLKLPEPEWPAPEKPIVQPPKLIAVAEHQQQLKALVDELAKMPEPDGTVLRTLNEAETRLSVAASEWRTAEAAILDIRKKLAEIDDLKQCPYCKSSAPGWQQHVRDEITKLLDKVELHFAAKTTAYDDAKAARGQAAKKYGQHLDWMQKGERMAGLQASLVKIQAENARLTDTYKNAIESIEERHKLDLERLEMKRQGWLEQRAADKVELERLSQIAEPDAAEVETANQKAANLMAELNEARSKVLVAERLQQDILRASQALREHQLCGARVTVIKEIRKTLQEVKGEMVRVAFGTLLESANSFTKGILLHPLAYDRDRNEIGFMSPTGFIAHRTFSGTEKALSYLAIAAALSRQADFRLLILDELGRLTENLQLAVLKRCEECLSAGLIDQVIAVIPIEEGSNTDRFSGGNWKVIRTSNE